MNAQRLARIGAQDARQSDEAAPGAEAWRAEARGGESHSSSARSLLNS